MVPKAALRSKDTRHLVSFFVCQLCRSLGKLGTTFDEVFREAEWGMAQEPVD